MSQRYIGGLIYNPPGGFSGRFDGSGDYLSGVGTTSSFNFMHNTTALFTFECWVYLSSTAAGQILIDNTDGTSAQVGLYIGLNAGGTIQLFITRGVASFPTASVASTGAVPTNAWTHIAVTYDQSLASNNAKFYINGVAAGSGNKTANAPSSANASNAMRIGTYGAGLGEFVNGYISNLRITNSIVYTAAFDPPVGPLQAITNTSLLTCAYSTFRDGSSNNFTITVNGNTAVSVQNPFPLTALPNPNLGNQGNGVYTMSQYQSLRSQNLWPAIDPYWEYVTLMLHGNGTNGAQNNTFLDSSTNNFTITRNGNTTQGTFTPYGSNWSNYFDGTGDTLTLATNAAFGFGTGDFTVELWVYCAFNGAIQEFIDARSADNAQPWVLGINGTGLARTYDGATLRTGGQLNQNAWNHVAWVRASNVNTVYVNGTSGHTWTATQDFGASKPLTIGNNIGPTNEPFTGYMSNLRILKGTALYTSAFTPPAAPLTAITNTSLLTCQSNRFIDNSSNNFTITRNGDVSVQRFSPFNPTTPYAAGTIGGSGYFDGSGDYLAGPSNAAFAFGTGDFTIEAWVNSTNYSGTNAIFDTRSSGNESTGVILYIRADGRPEMYRSAAVVTGSTALSQNTWNHVALTRSGSTCTLWLNGVNIGTATDATNLTQQNSFVGAAYTGVNNLMVGYISNLRVVKGTAVYTANFTPPTAPVTAITNTSLLLNFTNGGIIDNAMMNDLETVGNAQISTSVSKFGGGSLAFDGSGDWVNAPPTQNLEFGGGDFTFEFWLYPLDTTRRAIYHGSDGADWSIGIDFQSQKVCIWASSNGSSWNLINADGGGNGIGTITVPLNAWTHVAFVRSGTTWQTYINGVRDLNLTGISGSIVNRATFAKSVGKWFFTNGVGSPTMWNGYIDDLRITRGYARYTANFTPQRSQWQDQ